MSSKLEQANYTDFTDL